MKWTQRLFGESGIDKEDTVDLTAEKAEARAALARSTAALQAARKQEPEVSRLAEALRRMREANHFAERIEETFRRA